MHAYVVAGGTRASRAQSVADMLTAQTELIHLQAEKTTLTIKQIHELTSSLSITGRGDRLVWIEEAQQLTVPAQNALLKILEEPPARTTFYLTSNTAQSLLPTIRSRCQIISLIDHGNSSIDHLQILKTAMSLSPGDRLMSIVTRDRAESIAWIREIEIALKHKLADPNLTPIGYVTLGKIAHLALEAHAQLTANCSVSLVTQNFLLSLPKSK